MLALAPYYVVFGSVKFQDGSALPQGSTPARCVGGTDGCVIVCDGGTGGYGSVEAMGKMVEDLEMWERESGEGRLIVDPSNKTITHGMKCANRL